MNFFIMRFFPLFLLFGCTFSHTWIDQLAVVVKGLYVGDFGYPRGYVARDDPGYTGFKNMHLLPPLESGRTRIDKSDLLCHPDQRSAKKSPKYPRLKAAPGNYIAMRYTENGHVTLVSPPKGKPKNGGTVYVFGTEKPRDDEKIVDVLEWTRNGKGGDGRGKLLAVQDYDDGRCYQVNPTEMSASRQDKFAQEFPDQVAQTEQWCETDVKLPKSLKARDVLTLYWVWAWPTAGGGVDPGLPIGKDEFYTTCADIDIIEALPEVNAKAVHSLVQQNIQSVAVVDYRSRTALNPSLAHDAGILPGSTAPVGGASSTSTSSVAALPTITTSVSTPPQRMTTVVVTFTETLTIPISTPTDRAADEHGAAAEAQGGKEEGHHYGGGGSAKFRMA